MGFIFSHPSLSDGTQRAAAEGSLQQQQSVQLAADEQHVSSAGPHVSPFIQEEGCDRLTDYGLFQ